MDNGNLILPPFIASDYKQEVHAQVNINLFSQKSLIPNLLNFRHTGALQKTSLEKFSHVMSTIEQVQCLFSYFYPDAVTERLNLEMMLPYKRSCNHNLY